MLISRQAKTPPIKETLRTVRHTIVKVIILSFIVKLNGTRGQHTLNFANQGKKCITFSGTELFSCPELEADIKECQIQNRKTVFLSAGGTSSPEAAKDSANKIWQIFGPPQEWPLLDNSKTLRPFT
ncbi:glycoside hydrolase family 18 protein [Zopfia rhizophila CBS 207.26]|uniref:Glycoside hydrolase family 18 protein n=1 Tax=Zopfia rhizophila CBS 207.26 TaxID=1314779 RepID=A0A6A6EBX7_9PEZI|nr:glycoside hydrolase family 18 protein [Zopfia rhizophila CBS 207.26]